VPAPVDLLKQVPIFAGLDRRGLERVADSMKQRTFAQGDTVTTEGRGGVGFFVIENGSARVTVHDEERGKLGPGDYFGEIALLTESDRTATITAESDLRCWGMTMWDFRPMVEANASIAWPLLQALARKLRDAERTTG
jgi:CRP-like cAMP-binding protein